MYKNIMDSNAASTGQLNVVLQPPSCLTLDESSASALVVSGQINDYQIIPATGEVVLFSRSLLAGEVKTYNINFI